MKPTRLALIAAAGMLLTSASVYSLTPPGGAGRGKDQDGPGSARVVAESLADKEKDGPAADPSRFTDGRTLTVDGRLGHSKLVRNDGGKTFLMLEVKPADGVRAKAPPPAHLSIVIDRSGSMKGARINNAMAAATSAVDRLSDGDLVSVVTFDTGVQTVVAPTAVDASTRPTIHRAIQGIKLGGDTCISCGVEVGMQLLAQTPGKVSRMILLSDGDANFGIRDVPGFRSLAQRAQGRGVSITTIGVDVDFSDKIMTALALDSNGRHYFVASPAGLSAVFEEEAKSLTSTVASDAEVAVDLAPGVELERVVDRTFRRSGNRVVVPLGSFANADVKTVLLEVKVPSGSLGAVPVADVGVTYRDLVDGGPGRCGGKLATEMVATAAEASQLDPVVLGRSQRAETARVVREANDLFEKGNAVEARRRLSAQKAKVEIAAAAAQAAPSNARKADVDRDFQNQTSVLGDANQGFASPPPAAPGAPAPMPAQAAKAHVKENAKRALDMAF